MMDLTILEQSEVLRGVLKAAKNATDVAIHRGNSRGGIDEFTYTAFDGQLRFTVRVDIVDNRPLSCREHLNII
jgi:hypothetical protein